MPTNRKCKSRSKGCPVDDVTYFSFRTSFDLWNDIHYVRRITSMSTSVIYFATSRPTLWYAMGLILPYREIKKTANINVKKLQFIQTLTATCSE